MKKQVKSTTQDDVHREIKDKTNLSTQEIDSIRLLFNRLD